MTARNATSSPPGCPPRWGTPRTPERPTLGPAVTAIAGMLGKPSMPWQRHVANVALEIDPDTGLLVYNEVVLIQGRQGGKTTLILPTMLHRALGMPGTRKGFPGVTLPPQRIAYTTQTADKAREKWRDVYVAGLLESPLVEMVAAGSPRYTRNFELLQFTNGSSFLPISPSATTGATGDSLDLGFIDEAWAQVDSGVEQSISPTMVTRTDPQLYVVSTAKRQPKGQGFKSEFAAYLRAKMATGRTAVEAGINTGTAYFEWSAPDGADPYDPATWWGCLPAMGHTITEAGIAAQLTRMDLGDFCAEFLGWFADGAQLRWHLIPERTWEILADRQVAPGSPMALAVDVSPDRESAAIVAAGPAGGGTWAVEVVDLRRGADWVPTRIAELAARWRPCAVAVASSGAAGSLIEPMRRELAGSDVEVHPLSVPEMARAYGVFHDAANKSRTLRHPAQTELDAAVSLAWKRHIGAQTVIDWASPGDVTPAVAATEALWAAQTFGPAFEANTYNVLDSVF